MKIIAVIVTYYPDHSALGALLDAISPQVDLFVIVDNGSDTAAMEFTERRHSYPDHGKGHFRRFQENIGVAAAQNAGIEWAEDQGADYIILFDQDSLPAPDMVSRLIRAHSALTERGLRVSAVGPVVRDARTSKSAPFRRIGWFGTKRIFPCAEPLISADFLISSGMLFSIEALQAIGHMREELFIDHVDTDWFLRAMAAGYNAWGVRDATMHHTLGEASISLKSLTNRLIYLHKPFRYYYIYRNSVDMYGKKYATTKWISGDIVRLCALLFSILFSTNKYECYKLIATGILHGFQGKSGKYDREIL